MDLVKSNRYRGPVGGCWEGRKDGEESLRIHETIVLIDLEKEKPPKGSLCLLGFACDEGIKRNHGRVGAVEGPMAIRSSLAKLPHVLQLYDCGNVICEDGDLEASQEVLEGIVRRLHAAECRTFILGGGHETAWPHYKGIAAANPEKHVAIINYDAHFDLRPVTEEGKGSSGTSFTQIADYLSQLKRPFSYTCLGVQHSGNTPSLFRKAEDLNVYYLPAEHFHQQGVEKSLQVIASILGEADYVYVTVCLDCFASAFAPGVSAPQPLGIFPSHAVPGLHALAKSGKVAGIDFVELSPPHDQDGITAKLTSGLIFEYLRFIKK